MLLKISITAGQDEWNTHFAANLKSCLKAIVKTSRKTSDFVKMDQGSSSNGLGSHNKAILDKGPGSANKPLNWKQTADFVQELYCTWPTLGWGVAGDPLGMTRLKLDESTLS